MWIFHTFLQYYCDRMRINYSCRIFGKADLAFTSLLISVPLDRWQNKSLNDLFWQEQYTPEIKFYLCNMYWYYYHCHWFKCIEAIKEHSKWKYLYMMGKTDTYTHTLIQTYSLIHDLHCIELIMVQWINWILFEEHTSFTE